MANEPARIGAVATLPGTTGLLKYAISRGFATSAMSNTRRPDMMKLQAMIVGSTRLGSEQ